MAKNIITVWQLVKKYLKEAASLSIFSPIWGNDLFPPGGGDGGLKIWAELGLQKVGDLYNPVNKHPMSFDEIVVKYNIPHRQFFRYLQLRIINLHFIRDIMVKYINIQMALCILIPLSLSFFNCCFTYLFILLYLYIYLYYIYFSI